MNDGTAGSNGFKKWVYVGGNNARGNPPPPSDPAPPVDGPSALSGSYSPPTKAETAAAIERAGRILSSAAPPAAKPAFLHDHAPQSEAARLLLEIDQTIARLSSL